MDIEITLNRLRARCVIGAYNWEKDVHQDIFITIKLTFDGSKAVESDKLSDTFDYVNLSSDLLKAVENTRFQLIETLLGFIVDHIKVKDGVKALDVELEKPLASTCMGSEKVLVSSSWRA